jgi:hypothetical protein
MEEEVLTGKQSKKQRLPDEHWSSAYVQRHYFLIGKTQNSQVESIR